MRIGQVLEGQPAAQAGLRTDDAILAIDGRAVHSFAEIPAIVAAVGSRSASFRIWRDGQVLDVPLTPKDSGAGPKVGIGPKLVIQKFGPVQAVREALASVWEMTTQTFDVVGRLVTARLSPKTMMGPLGIAQASGEAAAAGWLPFVYLIAVISLQVGILNLLPVAPLDGGHLAIIAVEGAARRELSPGVKNWIMNAGAAAIFLLIGLVLYSDISKMSFVQKLLQ